MGSSRKILLVILFAFAITFVDISVHAQSQQPATPDSQANPATTTATASPPPTPQTPPANSSGMVWVNTDTGVYHKPGTRYYGKTKHGKYMLETDAIKAGYHAAGKAPSQ